MNSTVKPDLKSLATELATLESETFEIVDYSEISSMLDAAEDMALASDSTSTSSTSTCSSTTSTTSCCA
jgi:thiazolylpeptide-type bacteriocin precursor